MVASPGEAAGVNRAGAGEAGDSETDDEESTQSSEVLGGEGGGRLWAGA
jgi:hypothetical protein